MSRPNTLARLQYLYTLAEGDEAKRSNIRCEARRLAKKLSLPCPTWAVKRAKGEAEPVLEPLAPEPMPEISPELRRWREAAPGRCVNVRRDGSVRLITFTDSGVRQEAAFTDANHAARALMLNVHWRAVAKTDTRIRTASGRVAMPVRA